MLACGSSLPPSSKSDAVSAAANPVLYEPRWRAYVLATQSRARLSLFVKRHTLIRYDLRGCGFSDREGVEFSFEKYVEDLEAVIAAAGVERCFGVGLRARRECPIRFRISNLIGTVWSGGTGFDARN